MRPQSRRTAISLSACFLLTVVDCGGDRLSSVENDLHVITICELLDHLQSYRGKLVAIRGVYYYNKLEANDCAQSFVTGSHRWPSVLELSDSQMAAELGERVGFTTDRVGWDNLDKTCIREGERGSRVEVWTTVVGEVKARERYVMQNGSVAAGYGHLGALPAEIVVRSVMNVEVKSRPNSKFDYAPKRAKPA